MKDTSLEEKIKNLVFWTIIFFVIYLLVAYLLNSLWLKNTIKFKDIYDILKDGLTITAAFLAPVVALILFTDWRSKHVILTQDSASKILIENMDDLYKLIIQSYFYEAESINDMKVTLYEDPEKGSLQKILERIKNEVLNIDNNLNDNSTLINEFENLKTKFWEVYNLIILIKFNESKINKLKNIDGNFNELNQLYESDENQKRRFNDKIKELDEFINHLKNELKKLRI